MSTPEFKPSPTLARPLDAVVHCLDATRDMLDGFPVDALLADHLDALAHDPRRVAGSSRLVALTLTHWIDALALDIDNFPPASTTALSSCKHRLKEAREALLALRDLVPVEPVRDKTVWSVASVHRPLRTPPPPARQAAA